MAKVGTSNPDRTISLKGCSAQLKINIKHNGPAMLAASYSHVSDYLPGTFYQIKHLFLGFIGDPAGQFQA